jgi:hypothetical protein
MQPWLSFPMDVSFDPGMLCDVSAGLVSLIVITIATTIRQRVSEQASIAILVRVHV